MSADDIARVVAQQTDNNSDAPSRRDQHERRTVNDNELTGEQLLDRIADWLESFIKTAQPEDIHILTLWIVHTHLVRETYTTPRLLLDSPVPGSGKTTVLDHLFRLCFNPVQAASLSSPSLLARLLEREPRTILIDEADRTLNPKAEGVGELLAVLNSGYRHGASRPVLVPDKEQGGWKPREMSTYGPVAMAGNGPDLPDDTRSRCIRVLLLPDTEGTVQDSDWQDIEGTALGIREDIAQWADSVRDDVRNLRPEYPGGLKGRNRERWAPLHKVALIAGGKWPGRCEKLIENDLEDQKMDREAGLQRTSRHLLLLRDIAKVWPEFTDFIPTNELLEALKVNQPSRWGEGNAYGALTVQGMGRMLVNHFNVRADRETGGGRRRGYHRSVLDPAWSAFAVKPG